MTAMAKLYSKLFGLTKSEHTTQESEANRTMRLNSEALDKSHRTVHFDGKFCSCRACRAFKSQKEMASLRHAQEVKNSQRNRED
jgi:hypothetical protein